MPPKRIALLDRDRDRNHEEKFNQKIILIVAVLLVFLFGIFRVPEGIGGKALLAALQKQIHLGLDLQGGVHLILQVQVQGAVSDETDNESARIRDDLKTGGFIFRRSSSPIPTSPKSSKSTARPRPSRAT